MGILERFASSLLASAFVMAVAAVGMAQGPSPMGSHRVTVSFQGLRSDRGFVRAGLYTSSARWLAEGRAVEECLAPISGGAARCVFTIAPGTRAALAAMHDEDGDGQFDRDVFGFPQEGYGFSNDVREPFGPPSFDAASFLPSAARTSVVQIRYGI